MLDARQETLSPEGVSFMSAHRDCGSRPRDFGQMVCSEHIAFFWCFRYDKQENSPVGGKIDLVIQLRGAAEIDFQKERRNDETKTAISCSCLCHDGRSAHRRRKCGRAYLWRHRGPLGRGFHRPLERAWYRSVQQRRVCPNAPIARECAMVILGRAMGIEPIENPDLTKYADAAQVVSNNLLSQLVSVE